MNKNHPLWAKAAAGVAAALLLLVGVYFFFPRHTQPKVQTEAQLQLTIDQLKLYDGTDTSKPIYLAYQGNIYDVTAGKSYYEPGGTYHWLTGRDATSDLNLVGGEIIKRKYPVVGKIVQ